MEEVLEVYRRPYAPVYPVVCLDESPKQLVSEVKKPFMNKKGELVFDFEYKREGAAEIYMVCEPLGGRREVFVRDSHDRMTWGKIIAHIVEEMYPEAKKICIVEDNLSAHKKYALYELFEPERARAILNKVAFVHTPVHGSWLNIAEIELNVLYGQGLQKRIATKEELEEQCSQWSSMRNGNEAKVDWQFTTKGARIKLKRLYPTIKP